jgi:predicted Ser/Thr protein kinase
MMRSIKAISVIKEAGNRVRVYNPTQFKLIGQGAQGAVFKISPLYCAKVFTSEKLAKREYSAYKAGESSSVLPKIYRVGSNYIIMEYLSGSSVDVYLKRKGAIPEWLTAQIIFMIKEMKRLGFSRIDSALRHIFITKGRKVKIIDLMHAYTLKSTMPVMLFSELKKLDMLEPFLNQVKKLDDELYTEWKSLKGG